MNAPQPRRDFIKGVAAATTAAGLSSFGAADNSQNPTDPAGGIPRRPFGKTGEKVSIIGIGGSTLGDARDLGEATRIVHEAIDAGINFFDNAWEYHDGRSEEWMGKALQGRREKAFLMTKVCTHGRDAKVGLQQLEESLRRLQTDHLDLWQVHECVYDNDPDLHFAKGGVIEALEQAKKQGKVRFVGFTGHKDPSIHLKMLSHDYPFDSVQMPLNVFDGSFRSFEKLVLPELNKRNIAPIAMKSLNGTAEAVKKGVITAEEAIRYTLSLPIAVLVSGIDSVDILRKNLAIARGFKPMTAQEMQTLRDRCASVAMDGRFELYKTSKKFDADVGRAQHGFPPLEKMPT